MLNKINIWSQKEAIEYETIQELLTRIMAICVRELDKKEMTSNKIDWFQTVLKDVQTTKKNIKPTTPNLNQIKATYLEKFKLINTYA